MAEIGGCGGRSGGGGGALLKGTKYELYGRELKVNEEYGLKDKEEGETGKTDEDEENDEKEE